MPQQQSSQRSADQWTYHRNWRIAPIGSAFSRDRQNGVRDARAQVARRIDRVPCRAAQ